MKKREELSKRLLDKINRCVTSANSEEYPNEGLYFTNDKLEEEFIAFIEQLLQEQKEEARQEGRREQRELDCSLYGTACAEENFDKKWELSNLSKDKEK